MRKKLGPKLKLNHQRQSMEFIFQTVCVTCSSTEGACRDFHICDLESCYKRCWHFNQAVKKIEKVLDKYDR